MLTTGSSGARTDDAKRFRPRHAGLAVSALLLGTAISTVHADEYEAQWSARPLAGVAMLHEDGADSNEQTLAAGLSLSLSYGLSNRLDLGLELVTLGTAMATFPRASVVLDGTEMHGRLTRSAADALLLLGPTWRFGVSWVPVISVAAGAGARYRSAGRFPELDLVPSDKGATTVLDFAAAAHVGIERRVNRRLTVGAYVSSIVSWGPSAPVLPIISFSLGISYVHYPLLW